MKKSHTCAAIWTHAARTSSSFFPAVLAPSECRPQVCHVVRRRPLLCGGIEFAPLLGNGVTEAAPAMEMQGSAVQTSDPFAAFVSEASQLFGIPKSWIRAVIRFESAGGVRSVSPKGAMGLLQIMPETWADLRIPCGLGADPFDVHNNIFTGAAYLRELHDR